MKEKTVMSKSTKHIAALFGEPMYRNISITSDDEIDNILMFLVEWNFTPQNWRAITREIVQSCWG